MEVREKSSFIKRTNNNNDNGYYYYYKIGDVKTVTTKVVNVSGTRFEMTEKTWGKIINGVSENHRGQIYYMGPEVYVERHPSAFQCILYYQQCGELHLPEGLCPSTFQRELDFWGLDRACLAKCCFAKFMSYMDDETTLKVKAHGLVVTFLFISNF